MGRFTPYEKFEVVWRYRNEGISYRELAEEIGIDNSVLRYWVKLYEYHGDRAFTFPYTNYSRAFKLKVIQYIQETDTSVREASARFCVPDFSMVRRWKKKWEIGGSDALEPSGKGHRDMSSHKKRNTHKNEQEKKAFETVEEEVEYLRMENAYLKKLNALVQEKESSQDKKKPK